MADVIYYITVIQNKCMFNVHENGDLISYRCAKGHTPELQRVICDDAKRIDAMNVSGIMGPGDAGDNEYIAMLSELEG